MPVIVPIGPPNGADECTIEMTSSSPHRGRPPDSFDQQQNEARARQRDEEILDREVVEVAGVLDDRVEQRSLAALMGEKGVPGDDLRLLKHPEELWQQDGQGRHGDDDERDEVAYPAQHRTPERLAAATRRPRT